jgi:Tol biopolymer transport system component
MDRSWTLGGRALVLFAAFAVAAALVTLARGASASCNCVIANGKIAFASWRDGTYPEIYVMNPDGSGQTRLTYNGLWDLHPAWSPSGKKIAFDRGPLGQSDIYVMNPDGSGETQLTSNSDFNYNPTWSPSGLRIAYVRRNASSPNGEIYVMNPDGSNQTNITNNPAEDEEPAWSPDGKHIAFRRSADTAAATGIYVMNADGSNQTQLTNGPCAEDENPAWSPDGTKIAFEGVATCGGPVEGRLRIYVVNADGSGRTPLTDGSANDLDPAWSPDGKRIAFTSDRDTSGIVYYEIYVMNADGSGQIPLTTPAEDWNQEPSWQKVFLAKPSSHIIPNTGVPDSIFKWKAGGFSAREPVTVFFDGARIGATEANPGGRLDMELTVPDSARPGEHTLEAIGRWSGVTVRDVFVVSPRTG